MQEQTFQHISREIHDNINLSLTLAKLNLNTIDWRNKNDSAVKVGTSTELLTKSIAELSDISKSLNADIIIQQGLLEALKEEMQRIQKASRLIIELDVAGTPVYFDAQKELVIFRIIQEAFNNIIKHAKANRAKLSLDYNETNLVIRLTDDGVGFSKELIEQKKHAGLKNMETRVHILNGTMTIESELDKGTILLFTIPFQ